MNISLIYFSMSVSSPRIGRRTLLQASGICFLVILPGIDHLGEPAESAPAASTFSIYVEKVIQRARQSVELPDHRGRHRGAGRAGDAAQCARRRPFPRTPSRRLWGHDLSGGVLIIDRGDASIAEKHGD